MGSRNPQVDFYNPETLEALGQAFDATWLVLQARDPFRDFEGESELRPLSVSSSRRSLRMALPIPLSFESGRLRASR